MGAPGCDNAPKVQLHRDALHYKPVQFIYPFYCNGDFLKHHLDVWGNYPKDIREALSVIIVDDCSPERPAIDVLKGRALPVPIRLFRIGVDVRWNWIAARNIGAQHAKAGWMMMTDMDHVVSTDVLEGLVYGNHDKNVIYRFSRREHTGAKYHPHPNSWFFTREMFWKIGGYDEALSGHYGTDGEYRRRCVGVAPIRIMMEELVRYEYQGDSSTTHYKRKQPVDAIAKKMIKARKKDWRPRTLSFPYKEIEIA